eukprot:tig00000670_g3035.t1
MASTPAPNVIEAASRPRGPSLGERPEGSAVGAADHPPPGEARVLGLDISGLSQAAQFAVLAGPVLLVYQLIAYLQEHLFSIPGFSFGFYINLYSFAVGLVLSTLERRLSKGGELASWRAPYYWYVYAGFFSVVGQGMTLESLNYVNLPLQIVFKSAKVIPVMLAGLLVLGRRYSAGDYASAACFVVGLSMFTLADVSVSPKFHVGGIACLLVALASDAFVGNVQERLMRGFGVPFAELVQHSYLVGGAMCLAYQIATGELRAAVKLSGEHPSVFGLCVLYALTAYAGLYFVLALVRRFGAVTAVVVTSGRKLISIFLSFALFPKPFSWLHAAGALVLTAGSLLSAYFKHPAEVKAALAACLPAPLRRRLLPAPSAEAFGSSSPTPDLEMGGRPPRPPSPADASCSLSGLSPAPPSPQPRPAAPGPLGF